MHLSERAPRGVFSVERRTKGMGEGQSTRREELKDETKRDEPLISFSNIFKYPA